MCYILVDGIGNKSEDITLRRNMPPKGVMVVESTKTPLGWGWVTFFFEVRLYIRT